MNSRLTGSISRRTLLKLGSAGLAGFALPPILVAADTTGANARTGRKPKMPGILHNEDCTNFFYYQDFPAGKAGEIVDRYVDVLAGAGVSSLMCNTNARRTNYRSEVWQVFWDGYDPTGPDDQPFLAAIPPARRKTYRKLVGNMLEVHQQGVDYPARIIQRCRHHGISPWISLRMNDVHENNNLDHPFHSALWRKPGLFRQGHPGYYARALDYAHAEVRDHYRALIVETLQRYNLDGLELDFMREPYLFSVGKEQEGRRILTDWLRGIRALANDAAKRRGHAVRLGVRVPSCPDTALGLGLDAPAWAKEGLVDLVVAAPRWATLEFAMPLGKWRELLGDRVTLAGGLDVNYCPGPGTPSRPVTREEATGAAVAVLSGGADVVYLFNYFQHGHPKWPIPEYQRTLRTFASFDALLKLPRRHAVTFRDVTVPGETYRPPLPASGKQLAFTLPLGPAPSPGWQAEAIVGIATLRVEDSPPAVSINGTVGKLQSNKTETNGNRLLTYAFPPTALRSTNRDVITVAAAGNAPVKVLRVEVSLRPGD
jgi:hypothetical protein